MPSSNSKLLVKWQGPYTILRKMGPVTYEIHHPDEKRAKQIYYVNLLKEWKEAPVQVPVASLLVKEVDSEGRRSLPSPTSSSLLNLLLTISLPSSPASYARCSSGSPSSSLPTRGRLTTLSTSTA